jgi:hypothetical protein
MNFLNHPFSEIRLQDPGEGAFRVAPGFGSLQLGWFIPGA